MSDFEKGKLKFIRGGKYPHCHSVLIDDDVRAIIDPACDKKKLLSIHNQRPIEVIINSHGHEDHILYNGLFSNARLWVPKLDADVFKDIDVFINQFFQPNIMDEKVLPAWTQFLTETINYQPRDPDRLLEDKEILDFGQTQVQVLHTPGHTPGHMCFYFFNEKVLFLADLDLVKFGPYYGDNASSIDDIISSLQDLEKIDADIYLVSHGKKGVMDGDPAHIQQYIQVIYQREEELLTFLGSGPKTIEEITKHGIIYRGRTLANGVWDLNLAELTMMLKHIERLQRYGRIQKEGENYHLI